MTMSSPSELVLPGRMRDRLVAHLQRVAPHEGCGLIACDRQGAVKLYEGTNIERSPSRYNMDPAEVLEALNEIEQCGWELGAIYHSHPQTPAEPSETDLAYHAYPGALMVIVSLAGARPDLRAYRITGRGRAHPVPVRVLERVEARWPEGR